MRTRVLNSTLLLLTCVVLAACGSIETRKQLDALTYHTKAYGKLLRWAHYEEAAEYLRPRDGGELPLPNQDFLEDIRLTSYEIVKVKVADDQNEAEVSAKLAYYNERVNKVRTITDQQTWWFDEDQNDWYVDGGFPPFE